MPCGDTPMDPLDDATHAFVDAVKHAADDQMILPARIASILDVTPGTISSWFRKYTPPNLERRNDLSVDDRLLALETACQVPSGTFVSLYRAVRHARAQKRQDRIIEPDKYLGISRVHKSFPAPQFGERVARARRVRMLNTWFPNLKEMEPSLKKALNAGCDIEMILLNPYCTAAITRTSTLGYLPGEEPTYSVLGEVQQSLRDLASLVEQCDARDRLAVFVYPEIPALAIYQADDYILAGLFLHGRLAVDGPQLEISSAGSFMARVVSAELQKVGDSSRGPVPLERWEEWLNAHAL